MKYVLINDVQRPDRSSDKVFGESSVDRVPLFSESCITEEETEDCSNNAITAYLSEHLEYSPSAIEKGQDGLEQLYFVLNEQGIIESNIKVKVISRDNPCIGCTEAAIEATKNMLTWQPAMKNGFAVKAKIILPIRFEVIEYY